jgi:hypothetical protein
MRVRAVRRVGVAVAFAVVLVVAWPIVLGDIRVKRWLYRGGRPNRVARGFGALWAAVARSGVAPNLLVTLEVHGPSCRVRRLPLVPVRVGGDEYAVSMLGERAAWVRDVRSAGGDAVLLRGQREEVRLVEVPPEERAPILQAYLRVAAGARGHIPVDPRAPLDEFEAVAARFPVFRVVPRGAAPGVSAPD